jgi:hypothetical protein
MSVVEYLLWTARAIRVQLKGALVNSALCATSEQPAISEPRGGARERIALSYQERLEQLMQVRDDMVRIRTKHFHYALALGFALLILLISLGVRLIPVWTGAFAALPLAAAVLCILKARQCRRRSDEAARLLGFYERRLARLRHEWMGKGDPGLDLIVQQHLSARDLDLFGDGSMFELLCDVDTSAGRETLAKWLQCPASFPEVVSRQNSILTLRARTDLREGLELLREGEASEYSWRMLREWLVTDPFELPGWAPPSALIIPILLLVACVFWAVGLLHAPIAVWLLAAIASAEGALALYFRGRIHSILTEMQVPVRKLESLRRLCALIGGASLETSRLAALQNGLRGSAERIAVLFRLVRRLNYRNNEWAIWPFLLSMGTTRTAFGIERWRQRHGRELVEWIILVGEFEALMAIAAYAYENPDDVFAEFIEDGPLFEARDMGHPLMDPRTCVRNDITLGRDDTRFLLVTGCNMSGKSTLLRTVGLNATLAQMGAPVRCGRLRLSRTQVCASIRIEDSLLDGASRFYAEVQRLKAILDLVRSGTPVLFLIDELFAGTNSADRRVAAEAVIRALAKHQAIGLITSHDLALSEIGEIKELKGKNVHFTDLSTTDGLLEFDYRIHSGPLTRGNALKIVKLVGLTPG